ncbi:LuxR C-terminal-related transcriptional regulator [Pedomonas mirosovicensis]|uniref:LuxR C-terminal-related transcriptional regulator n=1 Tax=Pedomonas mirosovicensis TaxID=2908641 RepID=UPI002166D8CA|nr:response regulator transcription factor [Pedomonas mirosovicensis]MCH8684743.1 response regulator transcription factor [Pedomonas mirosovicensis]
MAPTIVIASDHPGTRTLVSAVRQAQPKANVVEASSFKSAAEAVRRQRPELVLVDLDLTDGGGFASLVTVKQMRANARVLALGWHEEPSLVQRARWFGAQGFLTWSAPPLLVRTTLARTLAGEECWLADAYKPLAEEEEPLPDVMTVARQLATLTPAQMRVLLGLNAGLLNKQIAYEMSITEATVKAHLTAVFRKLGVKNRQEAARIARTLLVSTPFNNNGAGHG